MRRLPAVFCAALCLCGPGAARAFGQAVDPPVALKPAPPEEVRQKNNWFLPIAEIVVMDTGVNLIARTGPDGRLYRVTGASIDRNFHGRWVVDDDPFKVNQFLHPYQGAMYHGIARSAGLSYWQSIAYSFAGSALWEIAGETTPPSRNDQIASGIAGPFLGEPLFRLADMLLHARDGSPGFWRVLGATLISPPSGVNHMMFGKRYQSAAPRDTGATEIRLDLGITGLVSTTARANSPFRLNRGVTGVSLDYGLPGRSGYAHAHPFDYFSLDATVSAAHGVETVSTRGLIVGDDYNRARTSGVWGIYGNYDYLTSEAFRLSTTALSVGTSSQFLLSDHAALQTTVLAGVGFSAAQTARGAAVPDYHYGLAPQGLIAAKLIASQHIALDLTGRAYYVSDAGAFTSGEHDQVYRGDGALTVRLVGRHAVSFKYTLQHRRAIVKGFPDLTQTGSTAGVFYTWLATGGFGAIR